jgi:hypothetical protein
MTVLVAEDDGAKRVISQGPGARCCSSSRLFLWLIVTSFLSCIWLGNFLHFQNMAVLGSILDRTGPEV